MASLATTAEVQIRVYFMLVKWRIQAYPSSNRVGDNAARGTGWASADSAGCTTRSGSVDTTASTSSMPLSPPSQGEAGARAAAAAAAAALAAIASRCRAKYIDMAHSSVGQNCAGGGRAWGDMGVSARPSTRAPPMLVRSPAHPSSPAPPSPHPRLPAVRQEDDPPHAAGRARALLCRPAATAFRRRHRRPIDRVAAAAAAAADRRCERVKRPPDEGGEGYVPEDVDDELAQAQRQGPLRLQQQQGRGRGGGVWWREQRGRRGGADARGRRQP